MSPGKELRAMLRVTLHERSVALKGSFSQNKVMESLSSVESRREVAATEIWHIYVDWTQRNAYICTLSQEKFISCIHAKKKQKSA